MAQNGKKKFLQFDPLGGRCFACSGRLVSAKRGFWKRVKTSWMRMRMLDFGLGGDFSSALYCISARGWDREGATSLQAAFMVPSALSAAGPPPLWLATGDCVAELSSTRVAFVWRHSISLSSVRINYNYLQLFAADCPASPPSKGSWQAAGGRLAVWMDCH